MSLGRALTLSSAVVLLAILLSSLCSMASSLPYRDINSINSRHRGSEEGQKLPSLKPTTTRHRLGRATSENVLSAATTTTTSQLPSPPEEEEEGSGAPSTESGPRCDEASRQQQGCRNLKEALVEYFRHISLTSYDLPLDTFYNSFVLEDLHYFNLLGNGHMEADEVTQVVRDFGERQCTRIISRYSLQNASSGICSWHYICSFDSNRFPRFKVEAKINDQTLHNRGICNDVQMDATFFQRQACPGDECGRSTWVRNGSLIRVGYEESLS